MPSESPKGSSAAELYTSALAHCDASRLNATSKSLASVISVLGLDSQRTYPSASVANYLTKPSQKAVGGFAANPANPDTVQLFQLLRKAFGIRLLGGFLRIGSNLP